MNDFSFFILLIKFLYVVSPIPNWDLSTQANILDATNPFYYTIYEKIAYDLKVILKKKIEKSGNRINSQNIVYVYKKANDNDYTYNKYIGEKVVEFSAIDSHYKGKFGYHILICPKGKFHPYDFDNSGHIAPPNGFNDNGEWDLRCYAHNTGYFYLFYLLKNGNNFFYKYNGDYVSKNYVIFIFL